MSKPREDSPIFITAALPYANGQLHFGHLGGVYLPADIYYRHSQLMGRNAVFICGSDEHGVAITLSAEKEGKDYQTYVDHYHALHQTVLKGYDIETTFYGRTTSPLHRKIAQDYFLRLKDKKALLELDTQQPFCTDCQRYVPDRHLGGTCVHCGCERARGDECPNCGKWLSFDELKDYFCQICQGKHIEVRNDKQWYLDLPRFVPELRRWIESHGEWKKNIQKYSLSLIESGLPQRAVTRHINWGIDVPGEEGSGRKLYVWFEAPIGYLSMLREAFESRGDRDGWKPFWNPKAKMIHFIGKDNIVFHTIVWPAMLLAAGDGIMPENVPANMYVLLKDQQFSKSAGWTIDSRVALEQYGSDTLRYYLTSIIPEYDDSSFSWKEFEARVNGELVNKIANFCNRVMKLIGQQFVNSLSAQTLQGSTCREALEIIVKSGAQIRGNLDQFEFRRALAEINRFAEHANKFMNDHEPWKLVKRDAAAASEVMAACLVFIAGLGSFLSPFLPRYAARIQSAFPHLDGNTLYRGELEATALSHILPLNAAIDLAIPRVTVPTGMSV